MDTAEGIYEDGYVSPIAFFNDPDTQRTIYPGKREESLFQDLHLLKQAQKMDAHQTEFRHFTHGFLKSNATVASKAGVAGAGNPVTVTLTAASHENGGKISPLLRRELVMVYSNTTGTPSFATVVDTDKGTDNAHTVTLMPQDPSEDLFTAVGINDVIAAYTNAHADGTTQPNGKVRTPYAISNYTQIIKNSHYQNGSVRENRTEVEVKGAQYYRLQGSLDAYNHHVLDVDYALLLGRKGIDTTADGPVYRTGGLDYQLQMHGHNMTHAGVYTDADMMQIADKLDEQASPTNNYWFHGNKSKQYLDNYLKAEQKDTGVDFTSEFDGGREVNYRFTGFVIYGYNFIPKKLKSLSHHPTTNPVSGSPWPEVSYIVGADQQTVREGNETKEIYMINLKYKPRDGEHMKHWMRGPEVTNKDQIEYQYLCEVGLQMAGMDKMIRIERN